MHRHPFASLRHGSISRCLCLLPSKPLTSICSPETHHRNHSDVEFRRCPPAIVTTSSFSSPSDVFTTRLRKSRVEFRIRGKCCKWGLLNRKFPESLRCNSLSDSNPAFIGVAYENCPFGARKQQRVSFGRIGAHGASHARPLFSTAETLSFPSNPSCRGAENEGVVLPFPYPEKNTFPFHLDGIPAERFLGCCEVENGKLRVAVLLSGGVDSSVALNLLKTAGHHCVAFYLKIWFQEDFRNFWSECPWEEDLSYAEAVCRQAGVELRIVHLTNEYWNRVVAHSVSEIEAGRTPNPDILCNSRVKFGAFYDHVDFSEFDRVASGHYAKVLRKPVLRRGVQEQFVELLLSADEVKDQTYFLSHLSQHQLKRAMFPLGSISKAEVRLLAEALRLPNERRRDSQGICFLGKVKFSEFVAQHLGERRGRIMEAETGEILGVHKGFWFHTIGQRQGLRLSGGPWYVVAKDVENNVVFVSRNYYSPEKSRRMFRAGNFSWILGVAPESATGLRCKVRHGPRFYNCSLEFCPQGKDGTGSSGETAIVNLEEDDQGLAPGQYAALYEGDTCLGSGVILEAMGGEVAEVPSQQAIEKASLSWEEEGPKVGKKKKRREDRKRKESSEGDDEGLTLELAGLHELVTVQQIKVEANGEHDNTSRLSSARD